MQGFMIPKQTPSEQEALSFDPLINAMRVSEYPNTLQQRAEYVGASFSPTYLGYNNRGASTTDEFWLIHKFTYDGSDRMTLKQTATGAWDDRATLSYS